MMVNELTTGELAEQLGCRLSGNKNLILKGASTMMEAGPAELTFLANPRYKKHLAACRAGAIIISNEDPGPNGITSILSANPYEDFKSAVEIMYGFEHDDVAPGVHPLADVHKSAEIGADSCIGANVVIGEGATLGARCKVYSGTYIGRSARIGDECIFGVNVSIRHEVIIGNRVRIGDGSVIGYDGFGYVPTREGYQRIRPVGTVEIDDDVHIGANCCVDRATVGATRIGRGSKLDNLIQVAHGVQIGHDTAIAAQTGISGSARIGSDVMIGGQAGLVGHISIGDKMIIGAQAGVTKSFDTKSMISGYPARPQNEAMRIEASQSKLPELLKRIAKIEKLVRKMESAGD